MSDLTNEHTNGKNIKLLYILLPIATIAVIAVILIPMIILNRPIDKSFPAPVRMYDDAEAYAFGAISAQRLTEARLSDETLSDELKRFDKYLYAFDGFWHNGDFGVSTERNTDESVPYYTKSTVSGVSFDGTDFKYTLYYTERLVSGSEIAPDNGTEIAKPGGDGDALPQTKNYAFRGTLPIGDRVYRFDGERVAAQNDKTLTVCFYRDDADESSFVEFTRVAENASEKVKITYSVTENDVKTETAVLELYSYNGFSLEISYAGKKDKYTARQEHNGKNTVTKLTVNDGKTYDISYENGAYIYNPTV